MTAMNVMESAGDAYTPEKAELRMKGAQVNAIQTRVSPSHTVASGGRIPKVTEMESVTSLLIPHMSSRSWISVHPLVQPFCEKGKGLVVVITPRITARIIILDLFPELRALRAPVYSTVAFVVPGLSGFQPLIQIADLI